jgi:hypothetical protein
VVAFEKKEEVCIIDKSVMLLFSMTRRFFKFLPEEQIAWLGVMFFTEQRWRSAQ